MEKAGYRWKMWKMWIARHGGTAPLKNSPENVIKPKVYRMGPYGASNKDIHKF